MRDVVTVSAGRPYYLYPLLAIVLLGIAVIAIVYRVKHPPLGEEVVFPRAPACR